MSSAQDQIRQNRANRAIQEMNGKLASTDSQPNSTATPSGELPIFGDDPKKVVQNLNGGADNAQGQTR
jgi:hypothetical protein